MKYPIYEYFYTFQGEGCHSGKPAFFIRTYGCPLKCSWCDSAGTWHKDWKPDNVPTMDEEELFDVFRQKSGSGTIVITGGEPAIFDLSSILTYFRKRSYAKFHLETSGAFKIKGEMDWVTVSPKWSKLPTQENLDRADEIKLIVEDENSIEKWMESIKITTNVPIWLHPEWSQRENAKVLNSISSAVKRNKRNFRAGWQLHKTYNIDKLDSDSKNLVPLGGKKENGY